MAVRPWLAVSCCSRPGPMCSTHPCASPLGGCTEWSSDIWLGINLEYCRIGPLSDAGVLSVNISLSISCARGGSAIQSGSQVEPAAPGARDPVQDRPILMPVCAGGIQNDARERRHGGDFHCWRMSRCAMKARRSFLPALKRSGRLEEWRRAYATASQSDSCLLAELESCFPRSCCSIRCNQKCGKLGTRPECTAFAMRFRPRFGIDYSENSIGVSRS